MTDVQVGQRVGGRSAHDNHAYLLRNAAAGMNPAPPHQMLIDDALTNMPACFARLMQPHAEANWDDWLDQLSNLPDAQVEREHNHDLQEVDLRSRLAALEARTPTISRVAPPSYYTAVTTPQRPGSAPATAPGTPTPTARRIIGGATPRAAPAHQAYTPAAVTPAATPPRTPAAFGAGAQLALDINYTPSLADTPQNRATVEQQQAQWAREHVGHMPMWNDNFPLTPGSAPASSGCVRCGAPGHFARQCSSAAHLPELEQAFRGSVVAQRSIENRALRMSMTPGTPSPAGRRRGTPLFYLAFEGSEELQLIDPAVILDLNILQTDDEGNEDEAE